jgi:hypothetical protein
VRVRRRSSARARRRGGFVGAYACKVCGHCPAHPNFETGAARGNLHVGIAEPLQNPARPRFGVTFSVKRVVKVNPAKRIIGREHKAWAGIPVRHAAPLVGDGLEGRPRTRLGAAGASVAYLIGHLRFRSAPRSATAPTGRTPRDRQARQRRLVTGYWIRGIDSCAHFRQRSRAASQNSEARAVIEQRGLQGYYNLQKGNIGSANGNRTRITHLHRMASHGN